MGARIILCCLHITNFWLFAGIDLISIETSACQFLQWTDCQIYNEPCNVNTTTTIVTTTMTTTTEILPTTSEREKTRRNV